MIVVITCREENLVNVTNQNDHPINVNFATYGFPEFGIWRLDPGEHLAMDSSETPEITDGYRREKPSKVMCEGSSASPSARRFQAARANGTADWVFTH